MKGYKDKEKRFHPITDYKKGTRKSRDQTEKEKGIKIRKQRVGTRKKKQRFDKSKIQSLIFTKTKFSKSQALQWAREHDFKAVKADSTRNTWRVRQFSPNKIKRGGECRTIQFGGSGVMGVLCEVPLRMKRGEQLQPFVKKNIATNLAEVDLFLRDLREEREMRRQEGKPTGIIDTDIRMIGGARNSIFSLLEQVPEPLHREIVMEADRIKMEMIL